IPILLVLGLAGRIDGLGLIAVNLMAALSLPMEDLSPAGELQHILWGVLALCIALFGAGRWSVDRFIVRFIPAA
ncbi:DoxX family protein, partial [Klebsiella pneumoniae]|uniref:DoxX family protein n=1 Tax=Klebsiella pneumoniae TaxID=573 RepID=UPI002752250D|nr:hypothetical protein [Klebsiella pneumoniae]